jgi:sulfite dehydrogenase (cytochrome) subunit B
MKLTVLAIALVLGTAPLASADEQSVSLKDAPGHEVVENNCAACHSLDYPRTNSSFLDHKGWQAEVDKMIKVFGAEITPQDSAAIVEYLAKNYGTGS